MISQEWVVGIATFLIGAAASITISRTFDRLARIDQAQKGIEQSAYDAHNFLAKHEDDIKILHYGLDRLTSGVETIRANLHKAATLLHDLATWVEWAHPVVTKAHREKPRIRLAMHRDTPTNSLVAKNRLRG